MWLTKKTPFFPITQLSCFLCPDTFFSYINTIDENGLFVQIINGMELTNIVLYSDKIQRLEVASSVLPCFLYIF